jgi:chemotaxis receptor (MCP) glutamine deamidase CheD
MLRFRRILQRMKRVLCEVIGEQDLLIALRKKDKWRGIIGKCIGICCRDYDHSVFSRTLELFPEAKRHADESGMKAYYSKTNDLTLLK